MGFKKCVRCVLLWIRDADGFFPTGSASDAILPEQVPRSRFSREAIDEKKPVD